MCMCVAIIKAATGRCLKTHDSYRKPRVAFTVVLDHRLLYLGLTVDQPPQDQTPADAKWDPLDRARTHVCLLDLRHRTLKYAFKCKTDVQVYPLHGGCDSRLLHTGVAACLRAELDFA
jgi:hypothetical protein